MDLFAIAQRLRSAGATYDTGEDFYAEFLNWIELTPDEKIPTAAATIRNLKLTILYNPDWMKSLSQEEQIFVLVHEMKHLLANHLKRSEHLDHQKANVAMDLLINESIMKHKSSEDCTEIKNVILKAPRSFIQTDPLTGEKKSVPTENNKKGGIFYENMKDKLNPCPAKNELHKYTFMDIYNFIIQEEENRQQNAQSGNGQPGDSESENGNGNGLDENGRIKLPENWDSHVETPEEADMLEESVNQILQGMKARGVDMSHVNDFRAQLGKPKKNYIKKIKSKIESHLNKNIKYKTWRRQNRTRQFAKGALKKGNSINVILDTSGSMCGEFDKTLTYLNVRELDCFFVMIDTEVTGSSKLDKRKLQNVKINGGGGTILQPALDFLVEKKRHKAPVLILTDGYTDNLDFTNFNDNILVLSTHTEIPYHGSGKVKQIIIED